MPDFTEVYRESFAGVYRYALRLCGDPTLAEEITQETFFRSLAAIDGFRGDCPLFAWLCRIARNCWLDHCREYRRRGEEPPEDPAVRMAFRFIRTALDENRVKYEARARKNRENGLLGGRPRNPVGSWESGKSGY